MYTRIVRGARRNAGGSIVLRPPVSGLRSSFPVHGAGTGMGVGVKFATHDPCSLMRHPGRILHPGCLRRCCLRCWRRTPSPDPAPSRCIAPSSGPACVRAVSRSSAGSRPASAYRRWNTPPQLRYPDRRTRDPLPQHMPDPGRSRRTGQGGRMMRGRVACGIGAVSATA